jgi:hypothetical protein
MQEKRLTNLIEEQLRATHQLVKIAKGDAVTEAADALVRAFLHRTTLLSEAAIERDIDPEIRGLASSVAELSRGLIAIKEKEFGPLWKYLRGRTSYDEDGPFFDRRPGDGYDGGAPVPARLLPKPSGRSGSDAKAFPVDELEVRS